MWIATFAGNRVDRFDVFRAQIVQDFADEADGLVFAHARLHRAVELVVGRIHHHRGNIEQRDFVSGLDDARVGHELLAVYNLDSFALQRKKNGWLDDVNAQRLVKQADFFEFTANFFRDVFGTAHFRRHRPAQLSDDGARAFAEPGTM